MKHIYKFLFAAAILMAWQPTQAQLTAHFTFDGLCMNQPTNFQDSSFNNLGPLVQLTWDFGDGTIDSANVPNPSHVFTSNGAFNVMLIVKDSADNVDTANVAIMVNDCGGGGMSDFGWNAPCDNDTVWFNALGDQGAIASYEWEFGDTNIDSTSGANVAHHYSIHNDFNVRLVTVDTVGNHDTTFHMVGHHPCPPPNDWNGCFPGAINFNVNTPHPNANKWVWNYDNGTAQDTTVTPNASHTYANSGTYNAFVIQLDGVNTIDTMWYNLVLDPNMCGAPPTDLQWFGCFPDTLTLQLNGQHPDAVQFIWNYGDGQIDTSAAPMSPHVYANEGNYNAFVVQLDTVNLIDTIWAGPMQLDSNMCAPMVNWGGCYPGDINFNVSNHHPNATKWVWNFNDGTGQDTSITPDAMHTFANAGNYNVFVIQLDAGLSVIDTLFTMVGVDPNMCGAPATDLQWMGCYPDTLTLQLNGQHPDAVQFIWNYGDGQIDTSAAPMSPHVYANEGNYNAFVVQLDTVSAIDTIWAGPMQLDSNMCAPMVNWGGCYPGDINFNVGNHHPNATKWVWNFNDGTGQDTSITPDAMHTFANAGNYNVFVIQLDAGLSVIDTLFTMVGVDPNMCGAPATDLQWMGCYPDTLTLQLNGQHPDAVQFVWNYGDGQIDTSAAPMSPHVYANEGNYNAFVVQLDTVSAIDTIWAGPMQLDSNMCAPNIHWNGCFPGSIFFNVHNGHPNATQWVWNFNDGSAQDTTTMPDVNHTYANVGNYNIFVIQMDPNGVIDTLFNMIAVDSNMCANGAQPIHINGCYPDTINFNLDQIDPNTTTFVWNFGDGVVDSLTSASANHFYNAQGNFNVSVEQIGAGGPIDTVSMSFQIDSGMCGNPAEFWVTGCFPDTVWFHNNADTSEVGVWIWNFGDGSNLDSTSGPLASHVFATQGNYDISLQMFSPDYQDSASHMMSMMIDPGMCGGPNGIADFGFDNPCSPDSIHIWANGDVGSFTTEFWVINGDTIGGTSNPVYLFPDTGNYTMEHHVSDTAGGSDVMVHNYSYYECGPGPGGLADFGFDNPCSPDSIHIWANGDIGSFTSEFWVINGDTIGGTSNPVYLFPDTGNYTMEHHVSDTAGGSDVMVHNYSYYECGGGEFGAFVWDNTCQNEVINFADSSTYQDITSWEWTFGNGDSAFVQNPTYQYADTGMYQVMMVVSNGTDSDTIVHQIYIMPCAPPVGAAFDANGVCFGDSTFFNNMSVGANAWAWDFGDGNGSTDEHPGHQYTAAGNYTVSLMATDGSDSVMFQMNIDIVDMQVSIAGSTDALCHGGEGTIEAAGSGAPAMTYDWDNGTQGAIMNAPAGTYNVFVVDDSTGCAANISGTISEPTAIALDVQVTDGSCGNSNGSATVIASGGTPAYTYSWSNSESASTMSNVGAGTYFISVLDANGCEAVEALVIIDNDGPVATVLSTTDANCGGPDGAASVAVAGGTAPLNYNWSDGQTGMDAANLLPGAYAFQVVDANGCVGGANVEINSNGNNPPSMYGHVEVGSFGFNMTSGMVTLFRDAGTGSYEMVETTNVDSAGDYVFPVVLPIGDYVVMAHPDTTFFPAALPTYGDSTHRWDLAHVYNLSCDTAVMANIQVINLDSLTGTSLLGGAISSGGPNKFGVAAGDPIPGIDVLLEQIPGGIVASATTDSSGSYSFGSVPNGNYTLFVDIPGLEMEESYDVALATEDSTVSGLDFQVGDTSIYIESTPAQIIEVANEEHYAITIYPNPYVDFTNITYSMDEVEDVQIEVYDVIGKRVFNMEVDGQVPGNYQVPFSGKEVGHNGGIFIVKLTIGDRTHTARIIEVQ